MARRPATLALLLCTLFTAARSAPALAAPPSGRGEPTRTILRFSNYRVLFDRVQQGYPTCGASFLYRKGTLELIFLRPTEDGRGQETFMTRSDDLGKTWVTERIVQQNADGTDFAHYYNVVNGQFVRLREDHWMFGFGNCDDKGNRHRILSTDVFAEQAAAVSPAGS